MKYVFITLVSTLLTIALPASANYSSGNGGARGASESGPWVNCQLPNGQMDYTPSENCMRKGGKVM